MGKINIIPIFVPHLGCPHDCIFCNQKKITGKSTDISKDIVEETIMKYLSYFRNKSHIEVAFYGGSFTAIDPNLQNELLEVAFQYKKKGFIHKIRISTRPDAIDDRILNNLEKYGVDIIELGVQSLATDVLAASERGHDAKAVYQSVDLIKKHHFSLGLQQMIGLPKDTFLKSFETTQRIIDLEPDFVRIYPTIVIKETPLEKEYKKGNYIPLTLLEGIKITAALLIQYINHEIPVIRMGLQTTDSIRWGGDIVSGPFHESFGQFVWQFLYYKGLYEYFTKHDILTRNVSIYAPSKEISNIVGYKKQTKQKLINTFKLSQLKVHGLSLPSYHLIVEVDGEKDEINILDYIIMENICI
ncbi:MAG: radical SAM protein [Tissierellia bacterium]|nr:radical SAM protein [Tissierellia bacterium]